jgi:outer membrane protein assembly factor BamD
LTALFVLAALVVPSAALAQSGPRQAPRAQAGERAAREDGAVTAQERYDLCLRYFKRGYYTKALETCNRVRNFHRDDPVSVLAELAVADIYYKRGDYEQSRLAYEDFVRLHPRHSQVDYAVWRIGLCWFKVSPRWAGRDQTPTKQAVNVWTGFDGRFPDSTHTAEVVERLDKARSRLAAKEISIARFYARQDAWRAVRGRAQGAVERYGDTDRAPEALALLARSWHSWGFESEAQQVRDRLATDYPGSAWLGRLDRSLAKAPGTQPVEETFLRPRRIPAGGAGAGAAAGAGAGGPGMGQY